MRKFVIIGLLLGVTCLWAEEVVQPIRVGLLLPLQTEVVKRDKNMDRFTDFYTGILMAVYKYQASGGKVEVYTFDVGKSVHDLERVLGSDTLDNMDMIIGPVYPAQVRIMATWTAEHHVLTLLPFAYEVPELAYNPYLLQFNPTETSEAEAVVNSFLSSRETVRFVFVEADEQSIPTSVQELSKCVKYDGLNYVYTSVRQIMSDSLSEVLSDTMDNVLVMNTERYSNVRQVMPYLDRASQGKRLTLMSRYAWKNEPIILPHIYTSVFREDVDIDSVGYGALYRQFVAIERPETHPCYDLLGYDLMNYTLETVALRRQVQDETLEGEVIERSFDGIQSDMRFVRVDSIGGYQNINIEIVQIR